MIEDNEKVEVDHVKEFEVLRQFEALMRILQYNKPNDRSEMDRIYAVALTDVQKAFAWFQFTYVGMPSYDEREEK